MLLRLHDVPRVTLSFPALGWANTISSLNNLYFFHICIYISVNLQPYPVRDTAVEIGIGNQPAVQPNFADRVFHIFPIAPLRVPHLRSKSRRGQDRVGLRVIIALEHEGSDKPRTEGSPLSGGGGPGCDNAPISRFRALVSNANMPAFSFFKRRVREARSDSGVVIILRIDFGFTHNTQCPPAFDKPWPSGLMCVHAIACLLAGPEGERLLIVVV